MNVALVIAGGTGQRMGCNVPKQFINVRDKPILIYTLENFQRHPEIDAIEVVCIDGWDNMLWAYARQHGIDKLKWVTKAGETCQESIRNGVFALRDICNENDLVVIHDGIRPMLETAVLSDVLRVCRQYGNAVTSMPYNEQIFIVDENNPATTCKFIPRETLRRVSTPQAYRFDKLLSAYEKAFELKVGIYGSSYTNTMMVELGETLHFAMGSEKNIKLTTKEDLDIFKSFLYNAKDVQVK